VSFLLDVRESGKHVALATTLDMNVAERLAKAIRAAGYTVVLTHLPAAVKIAERKDDGATN
jgi:hypothetical protein